MPVAKCEDDLTARSRAETRTSLYPPVLADANGVKAFAAPRAALLQHGHGVQVDELLRRGWRALDPPLPTLLDGDTLLAGRWRGRLSGDGVEPVDVLVIVWGVGPLGRGPGRARRGGRAGGGRGRDHGVGR